MKISLIVSAYENPLALGKVLRGLSQQKLSPFEILIADDGSQEPTRKLIDGAKAIFSCPVHHVWHPHDGFRKTIILNKALVRAGGDYAVFLDGDCVPEASFIFDHARLAEPGCWVQGRRCFVEERFVPLFEADSVVPFWLATGRIKGLMKALRFPRPNVRYDQNMDGILGCNMGIWMGDLRAVNGFDEAYLGWGREDSDLGARLYHLGRRRKLVHGWAVIYHLNHPFLSRDNVPSCQARLDETRAIRRIRCQQGLDQYLKPAMANATPNP